MRVTALTACSDPCSRRDLSLRLVAVVALSLWAQTAAAQAASVWRCGQEYTNIAPQRPGCVPVTQAAVTVIEGTRVAPGAERASALPEAGAPQRVAPALQRQRDQEARAILQTELQRARELHQRLQQELQAAPPAGEAERVGALRAALSRNAADMAGLQRELSRLDGGKP